MASVSVSTRFYPERLAAVVDSAFTPNALRRGAAIRARAEATCPVYVEGGRWAGPASGAAGTLRDSHFGPIKTGRLRVRVGNSAGHAKLIHDGHRWVVVNPSSGAVVAEGFHAPRPWLRDAMSAGR